MFETDAEYLRNEEERYKRNGLRIDDKDIILKSRYRYLKIMLVVGFIISIIYSLAIGFAFGRG